MKTHTLLAVVLGVVVALAAGCGGNSGDPYDNLVESLEDRNETASELEGAKKKLAKFENEARAILSQDPYSIVGPVSVGGVRYSNARAVHQRRGELQAAVRTLQGTLGQKGAAVQTAWETFLQSPQVRDGEELLQAALNAYRIVNSLPTGSNYPNRETVLAALRHGITQLMGSWTIGYVRALGIVVDGIQQGRAVGQIQRGITQLGSTPEEQRFFQTLARNLAPVLRQILLSGTGAELDQRLALVGHWINAINFVTQGVTGADGDPFTPQELTSLQGFLEAIRLLPYLSAVARPAEGFFIGLDIVLVVLGHIQNGLRAIQIQTAQQNIQLLIHAALDNNETLLGTLPLHPTAPFGADPASIPLPTSGTRTGLNKGELRALLGESPNTGEGIAPVTGRSVSLSTPPSASSTRSMELPLLGSGAKGVSTRRLAPSSIPQFHSFVGPIVSTGSIQNERGLQPAALDFSYPRVLGTWTSTNPRRGGGYINGVGQFRPEALLIGR